MGGGGGGRTGIATAKYSTRWPGSGLSSCLKYYRADKSILPRLKLKLNSNSTRTQRNLNPNPKRNNNTNPDPDHDPDPDPNSIVNYNSYSNSSSNINLILNLKLFYETIVIAKEKQFLTHPEVVMAYVYPNPHTFPLKHQRFFSSFSKNHSWP